MRMTINHEGDNLSMSEQFDAAITIIIHQFSGKLYYHEMIGILAMHQSKLCAESNEEVEEEEEGD